MARIVCSDYCCDRAKQFIAKRRHAGLHIGNDRLSFDAPSPANTSCGQPACPFPYPDGSTVPTPAQAAATLVTTGQNPPNFNTGPQGSFVTNSGGGIDHDMRMAYSEQASLQIDQQIGKGLVVSVGYLFLRGHKQIRPENLNVCPSAGFSNAATDCPPASVIPGPPITPNGPYLGNKLPDGRDAFSGVLYTNAGLMYYLDGSGNAEYDGATLSVTEKFSQRFRLNANYTWSHTRDDGTFTTFVSTPQDLYDRALERADSVQDVRPGLLQISLPPRPIKEWRCCATLNSAASSTCRLRVRSRSLSVTT